MIPDAVAFPILNYAFCHPEHITLQGRSVRLLQWQHLVGGSRLELVIWPRSIKHATSTQDVTAEIRIFHNHHTLESVPDVVGFIEDRHLAITCAREVWFLFKWATPQGSTAFQIHMDKSEGKNLLKLFAEFSFSVHFSSEPIPSLWAPTTTASEIDADADISSRLEMGTSKVPPSSKLSLRVEFNGLDHSTGPMLRELHLRQLLAETIHLAVKSYSRSLILTDLRRSSTWEHLGLVSGLVLSLVASSEQPKFEVSRNEATIESINLDPTKVRGYYANQVLGIKTRNTQGVYYVQLSMAAANIVVACQWLEHHNIPLDGIPATNEPRTATTRPGSSGWGRRWNSSES